MGKRRELRQAAARATSRRRAWWIGVAAVLAVVAILLLVARTASEPDDRSIGQTLQSLAKHQETSATDWLIRTNARDELHAARLAGQDFIARIEEYFTRYAEISAVRLLADRYRGRVRAVAVDRGNIVSVVSGPNRLGNPGWLVVGVYGPAELASVRLSGSWLIYDANSGAVLMPAVQPSDAVWDAALKFHELLHADSHRRGHASATAARGSDAWVSEELEAHAIEETILNHGTDGRYLERVRMIVHRRAARSLRRLGTGLKPEDVQELEQLFRPPNKIEAGLRLSQYVLNIGEEWIRQHVPIVERFARRIEWYRAITKAGGS